MQKILTKPAEILIVDDNLGNLELLSEILIIGKYSVSKASNCKDALLLIEQSLPSLIISDIRMPEMDGFEFCQILKANEKTLHIPVIFITALDDKKFLETGFQVGGIDHIVIPFNRNEVLARVKTHLNLYHLQQNLRERNSILEKEFKQSEERFESLLRIHEQPAKTIKEYLDYSLSEVIKLTQSKIGYIYFYDEIKKEFTLNTWSVQVMEECRVLEPETIYMLEKTGIWGEAVRQRKPIMINDFPKPDPLKKGTPEGHVALNKFLTIPVFVEDHIVAVVGVANKKGDYTNSDIRQLTLMMDAVWKNIQRKKDEQALVESEDRYRKTLLGIGDGVITTDTQGKVQIMNRVAEELTGWTQDDAFDRQLEEVFPIINEETRKEVEIPVRKVLRDGLIVGLANHTILIAKDGTERPIADSGAPIRNDKDEITGVVLVFRDQTEERNAEKALKESEAKFRNIFEHSPVGKSMTGLDGSFYVNQAFCDMMGYSQAELKDKNLIDIIFADDKQQSVNVINELKEGTTDSFRFEIRYVHKNGNIVWVDASAFLQRDSDGNPEFFIFSFNDITKRIEAIKALTESEYFFRETQKAAFIGSYNSNLQTGFWDSSEVLDQIFGLEKKPTRKLEEWLDIVHPDDQKMMDNYMTKEVIGNRIPFNKEYRIIRPSDGQIRWVYGLGKLTFDDNGEVLYMMGTIQDITERKNNQVLIQESERQNRSLIENLHAGIVLHASDTSILLANSKASELLGLTIEEMKGKIASDPEWHFLYEDESIMLPEDYPVTRVLASRKAIQDMVIGINRPGQSDIVWVLVNAFPEFNLQGKLNHVVVTFIDITKRKNAEEVIQNERKLLRILIDNIPDPIYIKDNGGRKLIANSADIRIMGLANEELAIGKTDTEIYGGEIGVRGYTDDMSVLKTGIPIINREENFVNKEGTLQWLSTTKIPLVDQYGKTSGLVGVGRDITEHKKATETIQKLSQGIEQSPSSILITDLNGNIEYVNPKFTETTGYSAEEAIGKSSEILKSGIMPDSVYEEIWDTISSGNVWRGELLNRKKNDELFWEGAIIASIKNDKGLINNFIYINEDIGLRKKMEADLIIAKEKAEESDRLKSAFLANMSHEIRTPLNSIIGFSELLDDASFDEKQKREFIHHISTNGNNLLNIISDIMDISKIESGEITIRPRKINVHELLENVKSANWLRTSERQLDFKFNSDGAGLEANISVFADLDRLHQIFNNLIGNALKFTSKGYIEIGFKPKDSEIEFFVKDTGVGIDSEFHERIFERFRQIELPTIRKYGGNGLGLTITKNLIGLMQGKIWLESEPGKGSTFYFSLPKWK